MGLAPASLESSRDRMRAIGIVFFVSFTAIASEMFFALLISLKTWSHMVYVVLSFALLGYGIGSNLYLRLKGRIEGKATATVLGLALVYLALTTVGASHLIPHLPIHLSMVTTIPGLQNLVLVYLAVALPFVGIGFINAFLFSHFSRESGRLYFWDLLGAGFGAFMFFPMVFALGPIHSLVVFASISLLVAGLVVRQTWNSSCCDVFFLCGVLGILGLLALPEPRYAVDDDLGWECIPNAFMPDQYEMVHCQWSPLGRTDVYRMTGTASRHWMMGEHFGTFEVCLDPPPEFCYISNSYRAGTPVYQFSDEGLARHGSRIRPFSQAMEAPYEILTKPRVLVIGAGGGRDIFMAKVHGAQEVTGAEINPVTYQAMSAGGVAYEYSGRLYDRPGVRVHNVDGRHLVKTQPVGKYDLLILNGVDTFAALSAGAYAYAENYLYTKEAVLDYLRVLDSGGIVNFNRWFEAESPRETLRLFVMILDALQSAGVTNPRQHVLIGNHQGWGITLVKKTPFTRQEEERLLRYFASHDTQSVFVPSGALAGETPNLFEKYILALEQGHGQDFIGDYWADISSVHDDSPFFYKYNRFALNLSKSAKHPAGGGAVFCVQLIILGQTALFIVMFLLLPLYFFEKQGIKVLPAGSRLPFFLYFGCIGLGFILIEMVLMQKFTLLLGSPIYSITVTLASLLIFSGVGSFLSSSPAEDWGERRVILLSLAILAYVAAVAVLGVDVLSFTMAAPFAIRAASCAALVLPFGICLGMFFPIGMRLVGSHHPDAVAWAWGVNSGFTVLGSTLSVLIAQFTSFSTVLFVAAVAYLVAAVAFVVLRRKLMRATPELAVT